MARIELNLESGKLNSLADFPQFRASLEGLQTAAAAYNGARARLDLARGTTGVGDLKPTSGGSILRQLELEQIEEREAAAREVLFAQKDAHEAVKGECAYALELAATPEHKRLIGAVLDAVIALSAAIEAEAAFAADLRSRGGSATNFARLPIALSEAVGSRSHWGSGVNELGRLVSVYAGRGPWNHEQLER